jgi:hypothetical protein
MAGSCCGHLLFAIIAVADGPRLARGRQCQQITMDRGRSCFLKLPAAPAAPWRSADTILRDAPGFGAAFDADFIKTLRVN